jgi:hypothetical protein
MFCFLRRTVREVTREHFTRICASRSSDAFVFGIKKEAAKGQPLIKHLQ